MPANGFESGDHTLAELTFPTVDPVQARFRKVVGRRSQGYGLGDALRAGFEALRRRQVLGTLHGDGGDHGTAGKERRQDVQDLLLAVQDADPGGRQHFVAGEDSEVNVQRLDVQGQVRSRLAGVQDHQSPRAAAQRHEFPDRVDGAQDVGRVGEGQHFGAGDQRCPAAWSRRRLPASSMGM